LGFQERDSGNECRGVFFSFLKMDFYSIMDNCIHLLLFFIIISFNSHNTSFLTFTDLQQLPLANITLEYLAPNDLLGNTKLAPLVAGKTEQIVTCAVLLELG
jgi:hypothetical protein